MSAKLNDLHAFIGAVNEDVRAFNKLAQLTTNESQFHRRTLVRTVFSCIEADMNILKQTALLIHADNPTIFTPQEVMALGDTEFYVADNGELKTRKLKIGLKANIRFAFRCFAKAFSKEYEIDFGNANGAKFLKAVKIRNQITHPKSAQSWQISKSDELLVVDAWEWFSWNLMKVSETK